VNVGVDVWNYRPVQIEEVRRPGRGLSVNVHWKDAEPRTARSSRLQ
jgi:hypothetical protein